MSKPKRQLKLIIRLLRTESDSGIALEEMLKSLNHSLSVVEVSKSLPEHLDLLHFRPWENVIILDIDYCEVLYGACNILLNRPDRPPLIVIPGWNGPGFDTNGFAYSGVSLLERPFDRLELEDTLALSQI